MQRMKKSIFKHRQPPIIFENFMTFFSLHLAALPFDNLVY